MSEAYCEGVKRIDASGEVAIRQRVATSGSVDVVLDASGQLRRRVQDGGSKIDYLGGVIERSDGGDDLTTTSEVTVYEVDVPEDLFEDGKKFFLEYGYDGSDLGSVTWKLYVVDDSGTETELLSKASTGVDVGKYLWEVLMKNKGTDPHPYNANGVVEPDGKILITVTSVDDTGGVGGGAAKFDYFKTNGISSVQKFRVKATPPSTNALVMYGFRYGVQ